MTGIPGIGLFFALGPSVFFLDLFEILFFYRHTLEAPFGISCQYWTCCPGLYEAL